MRYPFIAPVNGATQYQDAIRRVRPGDSFTIRREPDNPYDSRALAVYHNKTAALVGYLPAPLAARIEEDVLEGEVVEIFTKGTWGLRIKVTLPRDEELGVSAGVDVLTRSGRKLGQLIRVEGDSVVVGSEDGEVTYPLNVVVLGSRDEPAADKLESSDSRVA